MATVNPIELGLFSSRVESISDEMGAALRRAAFSPNIKDRLDFSCAIFDAKGELTAQAAHIPVHLGSMAYAMGAIVGELHWQPGDMVVMNDPYKGGTHLPDVTVIAPVYVDTVLVAFVANRAHHANIGAASPGSMPVSRSLHEEGIVIEPIHLQRAGHWQFAVLERLAGVPAGMFKTGEKAALAGAAAGDFSAQVSANRVGVQRLQALIGQYGAEQYAVLVAALNDYACRLALTSLQAIPAGEYVFTDYLDDDGAGTQRIPITARVITREEGVVVDFAGTAAQVPGNVNCPLSVAAAAVFYVFRCLMPPQTPACAGAFRPIQLHAPQGSLLNARFPAAVAAGNVETSTRVVDVLLGALAQALPSRIPAASHGSMNNLAMGALRSNGSRWDYYETIAGGMGASVTGAGLSAVQTHMTNTLNTPVESLEAHYPLRVKRYQIRHGSGGAGQFAGGDGVIREVEFLEPATVSLLTERRALQPWGLQGGQPGMSGRNGLNGAALPAKVTLQVKPGDVLTLETPGGGGWGSPG